MGRLQRLLCCLLLCLSLVAATRAATVHQEWEIVSYQFKSPDCVRKLAVTISGQTPGPTIRATQGDTVVIRVKNSLLTENVAIHWHGIRQIGTPWADGTEGVTQCTILPCDTFTYTFVVDRPGTYMYHAHYGMQRSAGLNGLIVVNARRGGPDAEPFAYDGEHDVLLNDWWHKSTYEQATGLASVPIGWVGEPHSLGRGRFNCSAAAVPRTCNATSLECSTPVFDVVPGKTYRFRIASVTSLSVLNFEIEEWEVSYQFKSLDCMRKLSATINGERLPDGETPGPTIRATRGDRVEVKVRNSLLTENLAIHWHGIRQIGTPWADGTEGVTQCPILPGDTFTYTFVVGRPGTYMYHAHYGMHRSAGLNGLIVMVAVSGGGPDAEPFRYYGEHEVLLNDWWHKITYEQATGLGSVRSFVLVGKPQSLFINGRGSFVNSSAMAARACNVNLPECATPVFAIVPDAEPFRYDGEHEVLLNDRWHKITYEQATGLGSARSLVLVAKPQSLLINARGMFINCSAMAARVCNGNLLECATPVFAVVPGQIYRFRIGSVTSLSALDFKIIEDRNARLIGYPAPVPAVASDATSSRRPLIGYALAVVTTLFATLYLATGRPVADQNPETAGGAIEMSAPAPSVSGSLPFAGGHAPPPSSTSASSPSTSSGDPAGTGGSCNPSGTLSTPPSAGPVGTGDEERPSSPHRSPLSASVGAPDEGQRLSAFLLGFLAFGIAIMLAIFNIGFERIISDWNSWAKVVYKVSTWLATVFLALAVGFIAAWYKASSMTRNRRLLSISDVFAKLGVILSIDLLVVITPCSLGRGACVAAMPSVAVISFLIATVGIWGRMNFSILGPRRRRQRPDPNAPYTGDDMV